MADICEVCALPKDLCVCKDIEKEQQKIRVLEERKRFRKYMTVVKGIDNQESAKKLCKILKRELACGGTVTPDNEIELQGNHSAKVKKVLIKEGYNPDLIEWLKIKYQITEENVIAHELIGLQAKVIKSSSKERIGIKGKIVFETRNLIIIDEKNHEKKIPKKETTFEIELLDKKKVIIEGKKILARPEERIKLYWRKYYGRM